MNQQPSSSTNNEGIVDQLNTRRYMFVSNIKRFSRVYSVWLLVVGIILILCSILSPNGKFLERPVILEEVFSMPGFYPQNVPEGAFKDCPPPVGTPKDAEITCRWSFVRYEPSFYEKMWHDYINEWAIDICGRLATDVHLRASQEIVSQIQNLKRAYPNTTWTTVDSIPAGKLEENYEYMSRFHYERECINPVSRRWKAAGKGVQLIEPLWGWLRDPFDTYCNLTYGKLPTWDGAFGQSKEHIMPLGFAPYGYTLEDEEIHQDQWRTHGIPPWKRSAATDEPANPNSPYGPARRIAIDMGSSYFNYWYYTEWTTAASGRWLYNNYHQKGIKFDKFLQFEAYSTMNKTEQWSQIPEDLFSVYKFINGPVNIDPKSANHVSQIIRTYVRPHDFFSFKFDIDTPGIEAPFTYSLLVDDSIANLIDEFYFEHHVDCDAMRVWGYDLLQNMTDSYILFTGLREKGIRAHSWP